MPARRPGPVRIPAGLAGPVEVALARSVERIPGPHALPGGSRYDVKIDGYRGVIVRSGDTARIWSRQGNDLTASFPDVAAAAVRMIPEGVVVDGELCVVTAQGRLDFGALQQRLASSGAKLRSMVAAAPATFMAFDLLAAAGVDLRTQRWTVRRRRLEQLAGGGWGPPIQLTPVTADPDEAREWFDVLPAAMGIEGLVVKGANSRYVGGSRDAWLKVKHRATVDVLVGGVLGPIDRPEVVIAGLYRGGELVVVGRTVPLTPRQSAELGAVLRPAGPDHPWPDEITSYRWGGKDSRKPLTKVVPVVVAEVSADAALQEGQHRHPLRLLRIRAELPPEDVPALPATAADD